MPARTSLNEERLGRTWQSCSLARARWLLANTYAQLQERVTHKALIRFREDVDQGSTVYWLNAGADEPEVASTAAPDGRALYVVTATDADPDGRPGEFLELTLREGGNQ